MDTKAALKAGAAFAVIATFFAGCAIVIPWLCVNFLFAVQAVVITVFGIQAGYVAHTLYKIFEAKERIKRASI